MVQYDMEVNFKPPGFEFQLHHFFEWFGENYKPVYASLLPYKNDYNTKTELTIMQIQAIQMLHRPSIQLTSNKWHHFSHLYAVLQLADIKNICYSLTSAINTPRDGKDLFDLHFQVTAHH